jgi:hypothetical protein
MLSIRKNQKSILKTNYETLDILHIREMKRKAKKAETSDSKQEPAHSTAKEAEKMSESETSSHTEKKKVKK